MGKNTVQAKQWIGKCYLDSTPSETMVKRWYADFKCGCTDTNDAECLGCPNSAVVPESIKKLYKFVLADCKLKLHEIAEELKIFKNSKVIYHFAWTFVNKNAVFKVGAVFAHSLSKTTTRQQFSVCNCFNATKKSFCINVTMDETWINQFIPKSNWQSAEWTAAGKSCPKWPKTQISASRVLASVFWDV